MDHLNNQMIVDEIKQLSWGNFFQLEVIKLAKGLCELRLNLAEILLSRNGEIDSRIYYIACDLAGNVASSTLVNNRKPVIPLVLQVKVLSSTSSLTLTIDSNAFEAEEGIFIAKVNVIDESGKQLAIAELKYKSG